MIDHAKLDLLILIRLSEPKKKATASSLRKPLEPYLEGLIPKAERARLFDDRIAALRRQGFIEQGGFGLTSKGQTRLFETIGTKRLPWRAAPRYLTALALGLDPDDKKVRGRLGDAKGIAAAVLSTRHDLEATTLTAAVDQLAWKLLTGQPGTLTLNKARNHLLSRELGAPARGTVERTARRLAAKELGASGTDARKLGERLTETWLAADAADVVDTVDAVDTVDTVDTVDAVDAAAAAVGLREFARRVNETARTIEHGRWGARKVYISALWRALATDPIVRSTVGANIGASVGASAGASVATSDLAGFKQRLCEANRQGLVSLHRADLVGAMDQGELAESEAQYMNATFHFVEAPR